jgi:arabinogalactan endo-1,4-beta-galactosidase
MVCAVAVGPGQVQAATPPIEFGVGGFNMVKDNPDGAERRAHYTNLRELGVRWIRTEISWDKIEVAPGVFEWGNLDRLANEAKANGIKLLAVVHRTAAHARPADRPEWYPAVGAERLAAWSRFLRTVALRYTQPLNRRIQAVEVWNEPNNPLAWDGPMSMDRYVALLRRARTELKAVNPATVVVTGGLAPTRDSATSVNPRTFVQRLYAAGARQLFDAVAMHPYTFPALASDGLKTGWGNMTKSDQGVPSMRATMVANGDGAKKIWATEFGAPTSVVGEARQATIASDGVRVWSGYSWAGPFIYMGYKDQAEQPGWHKSMGLLRSTGTRRPSFAAYKNAIAAVS